MTWILMIARFALLGAFLLFLLLLLQTIRRDLES